MNSEMENLRSVAIISVIFIWNHTLFLNRNSTITRLDDRKIGSKRNEKNQARHIEIHCSVEGMV